MLNVPAVRVVVTCFRPAVRRSRGLVNLTIMSVYGLSFTMTANVDVLSGCYGKLCTR